MLLSDDEIQERMESPLNLLNRLKSSLSRAVNLPHIPSNSPTDSHTISPVLPPSSSDIVADLEDKIANGGTRSKAVGILNAAMDQLRVRIPEVQKPEKLAQIAAEMAKVVNQHDNRNTGDKELAKIVVYAPQIQSIENYQIVNVNE